MLEVKWLEGIVAEGGCHGIGVELTYKDPAKSKQSQHLSVSNE